MKLSASEGGWENPKLGMHKAVCVDDIELPQQETKFGLRDKLRLVFLLEQKRSDGEPMVIGRTYGASLSAKSDLRRDLKSWRGADLTADELKGFDTAKLVGAQAQVNITEFQKHDGTAGTQIETILPPADGQNVDGSAYKPKDADPEW